MSRRALILTVAALVGGCGGGGARTEVLEFQPPTTRVDIVDGPTIRPGSEPNGLWMQSGTAGSTECVSSADGVFWREGDYIVVDADSDPTVECVEYVRWTLLLPKAGPLITWRLGDAS